MILRNNARILIHDSWFFWDLLRFLKFVVININTNLMVSIQLAIPGALKIKAFWSKVYEVIISIYDITNKILSCGSSYIVDVLMGPRFGDSNITMREVNHNFPFLFYNCLPWKKKFLGLFLVWSQHFLERILKFEKFPPILNRINVKLQITKTIIKKKSSKRNWNICSSHLITGRK